MCQVLVRSVSGTRRGLVSGSRAMATNKKILKYDPAAMEQALKAVKENNMSVKAAAKIFNIPKTTLYYKVIGKYPEQRKMGPSPNLTPAEEKIIINWMFECAKMGFPVTKEQLLESVELYIKKLKRKTSFTNGKPGDKWFKLFQHRNPEVAPRLSQNLTHSRAAVTEESIRTWFKEIKNELKENNQEAVLEDAMRIFNADETAIFLSPKGQRVLVRRGEKTVYSFTNNDDKECVTLLLTANSLGTIAPPMVIFKYDRVPSTVVNEMPQNWSLGRSDSGWMTGQTFYEYIANIFHPWLIQNQIELPVLLFVDGHSSHLTYSLSEFCSQNGIIIAALLPNSTHILQPLDVAVFRPLKEKWKKVVHAWKVKHSGKKIKRENFAPLMESVLQQIDKEVFINGFRTCGLFPFNENAINYKNYFKLNNVDVTSSNQIISQEMIKIHLKFLEKEITAEKVKEFQNGNISIEDKSLYNLWKKLLEQIDDSPKETTTTPVAIVHEITEDMENRVVGKNETSIETVIPNYEVDKDIESIVTMSVENTEEISRNIKLVTAECEYEQTTDSENQSAIDTNSSQILGASHHCSPVKRSTTSLNKDNAIIPSPFKDILFWPQTSQQPQHKKPRVKIPSVISSLKGKEYFLNKEREKEKKEKEKEERKRQREEKRKQKQIQAADKTNKRKSKNNDFSDSDSSVQVPSESEGEGDNWDQVSNEDNENFDHTNTPINQLELGDHVIVLYQDKYYPGRIKNINTANNSYFISSMIQSGFNFRWPTKEDQLWFPLADIICKIKPPVPVNSRGTFKVPEMANYITL